MADRPKCEAGAVRAGKPRVALALLALACVVAGPLSSLAWPSRPGKATGSAVHPVAVFGSDDRGPLPARYKEVREKIGLLFSVHGRSVCTAFCVAKDVIATAGHCLLKIAGERAPRIGDFWFLRNYDVVRDIAHIAGHANGTAALNVMSGSMSLNVRPPIEATRDWALVRLARPACTKGVLPIRVLPVDQIVKEANAKRVFQISYHRDYTPWKLAYGPPCGVAKSFGTADWSTIAQDFSDPDALILHTCDTGGASSGSPLLLDAESGPEVIGINVGTYVHSKVLMQEGKVMKRMKADPVANTGVASAAFAEKLEAFREAVALTSPAQVRELQTLLKGRQLFAGKVDGNYGADLRAAIEAYERAEGLPVTGLATLAILKRLGGSGAVPAERPKGPRKAKS
jgi:Putative peptidoglycan binding domain/Trypsin-like peptidase domain